MTDVDYEDEFEAVREDGRHVTVVRYFGILPFGICDTCGWEGPTRDLDREAADDARSHLKEVGG